ncbi:hypothetical protein ACFRAU_05000 [Arthrobacter sp. NPDC056691]|uniref:hypothetical protein n=1 Tax=unclassified Arthrobacter TaxID=235627 RepID=UPI00366A625D
MAEDFDSRLLESAKVRKSRLDDAFLFGRNLQERSYSTFTARLLQSLLVAALIAAICVGYSFVQHLLSEQSSQPGKSSQQAGASPVAHNYQAGAA